MKLPYLKQHKMPRINPNPTEEYASGGVVDNDDQTLMGHCAMELMEAVETKDKAKFMEALEVLVADILNRMGGDSDVNG